MLGLPLSRISCLILALLLLAAGCGEDKKQLRPGTQMGAAACTKGADCQSNLCIQVAEDRAICTVTCDPANPVDCPAHANWRCAKPDEIGTPVCQCTSDSKVEICGDGIDNDCNAFVDDCMVCDGKLAPPDDNDNCGACARKCIAGASCKAGECVCPDGTSSASCVREPGSPECTSSNDCDDEVACTEDSCAGGQCVHAVVAARCAADEVCDLRRGGCQRGMACAGDSDCKDSDPCTTNERCDPPTRVCLWQPLDGDGDEDPPRICGGTDCNDADKNTRRGVSELCDGQDNNCDGQVDLPIASDVCGADKLCFSGTCVCTGENVLCQGACVDLKSDATSCGACGKACGVGQACSQGSCVEVDECATGAFTCAAHMSCVNKVGGYNCVCDAGYVQGTAGTGCVDRNECTSIADNDCFSGGCKNTEGSYTCECPAGYTGDGRTCTDVDECASVNCSGHGVCFNSIGSYQCQCDAGYTSNGQGGCVLLNACQAGVEPNHKWCNGACADILQNANHCGNCGVSCGTGGVCVNGACSCSAGSGLSYCAGRGCVNLASNAQTCGECTTQCAGNGGFCVSGDCFCPTDQKVCNGSCTQLGTTTNCGDCGVACPGLASCNAAKQCVCPAGSPDVCGNTCVNRQTSVTHCGSCNNACAQGASCTTGTCRCPSGQSVCNNTCVDTVSNPQQCGTCGQVCAAACSNSACVTAVAVGAGNTFSCALLSDGRVRCWGTQSYGQLGNGVNSSYALTLPQTVQGLSSASQLSVGYTHACAINTSGALYCWGSNGANAASLTSSSGVLTATLFGQGYSKVAAGADFTCAQRTDGTIACWGTRQYGQGGDGVVSGVTNTITGPAASVLSQVDKLVAGQYHVCALKAGTVYCWGTQVADTNGYFGTATGPVAVPGMTGVSDVAAGGSHTCAVKSGAVYCWGAGGNGQLGNGSNTSRPTPTQVPGISTASKVYAGSVDSCIKLSDNSVSCFGYNGYGQLGTGSTTQVNTANVALVGGSTLTGLSLGNVHSCAINAAGGVACWGYGGSYATGFASTIYSPANLSW